MKDWIGNKKAIFVTLGASNHTDKEREKDDFYATSPIAIDKLKQVFELPNKIYEPCCGQGDLSERLKEFGHQVYSTDLIDRGYGDEKCVDFLLLDKMPIGFEDASILTNPPHKLGLECILKSLNLIKDGNYVIMFMKTQFLEGKNRYENLYSKFPPKYIFQSIERILCAKNGDFEQMKANGGSAVSYAWYVWQKGYKGDTTLRWM